MVDGFIQGNGFEELGLGFVESIEQLVDHDHVAPSDAFDQQSPSFLAHQRDMQRAKDQNTPQSLFSVEPSAGIWVALSPVEVPTS